MLDAFDKIFLCCTLSPRGKCKCIFCAQSRNRFFCNFASGKLYSTTTRKICFLSDIILWSNLAPAFSASLRFTAARPCKKFATKVNGAKTLRNIGWMVEESCFWCFLFWISGQSAFDDSKCNLNPIVRLVWLRAGWQEERSPHMSSLHLHFLVLARDALSNNL